MRETRDRRHLLILAGLVCLGFSWEERLMPIISPLFAVVWYLCLRFRRPERFISEQLEALVMIVAFFATFLLSRVLGVNNLIFLGANTLIVFQTLRLLWPIDSRQQLWTIVVAMMHIAVGSQYNVDYYTFIPLIIITLFLLPRSLLQVHLNDFKVARDTVSGTLRKREIAVLAMLMVLFFFFIPRLPVLPRVPSSIFGSGRDSQLSNDLNARGGGSSLGDTLVLRLQGEAPGYLRAHALDTFDDERWTRGKTGQLVDHFCNEPLDENARSRTITIVNSAILQGNLPTDGYVLQVRGLHGSAPYIAADGSLTQAVRPYQPTSYEYWSTSRAPVRMLKQSEFRNLTALPPQSQRLQAWLDNLLQGETDPARQVAILESHLQTQFQYELGAPILTSDRPVEEFLVETKAGHCGRYASALAVLLRMKKIPSRVVMGYVVAEQNAFGQFYNVRVKHSHAWTEAYLPERGWVQLDGTPSGASQDVERRLLVQDFYEWFEFTWYGKIVEFDYRQQGRMAESCSTVASSFLTLCTSHIDRIVPLCGLLLLVFACFRVPWRRLLTRKPAHGRQAAIREARHFYADMVRILVRQGFKRTPQMTPCEFLRHIEAANYPHAPLARVVTEHFCELRYGKTEPTQKKRHEIQSALVQMSNHRKPRPTLNTLISRVFAGEVVQDD